MTVGTTKCECDLRDRQWNGHGRCLRCGRPYEDRRAVVTSRPERLILHPSIDLSFLLEVFELGAGPIGSGTRHAVWMHRLKKGGYRWACTCGSGAPHHELNTALVMEVRAHFDQAWEPAAVPIWHPLAIWNDRARGDQPPSVAELERLARGMVT